MGQKATGEKNHNNNSGKQNVLAVQNQAQMKESVNKGQPSVGPIHKNWTQLLHFLEKENHAK